MIKCVLQEYLSAIAPTVGKRMYSQELIYGHFSIFHRLVQSTQNRLLIAVHKIADQNKIKSISFK